MVFEDRRGVADADRNDRATGFRSDLEGTFVERKQLRFRGIFIPGAFREDHDRNAVFDIVDGSQDGLEPGFDIGAVQKQTVEKFHPPGEQRHLQKFLFRDIAGETRTARIGEHDVEEAAVVADVEHRLILWNVFLADDGELYAGEKGDDLKGTLYDAQGADVARPRVEFSDDPFDQKDRNREDQKQNNEDGNDQKSDHKFLLANE